MTALDHAIWWHVYPLGACGAPIRERSDDGGGTPVPRLRRLENWLDYAVELGCSGLLLGPVFASSTHGYDTIDHFRLDPRLGDEADWARFSDAAHAHGLQLVLDGVFNHVGAAHALVAGAFAGAGMVHLQHDTHRAWEGHTDLAELDHADPRVADLVVDVMTHWLDRGADGWRLDVAYAVPAAFWSDVLGRVRAGHPDAFFVGEAIHGDYAAIATAGTLDAVTAYELWKAVWSSLADRNLWELAWALDRHDDFAARSRMQTFVGNHDVTRVASRVGDAGAALAAIVLLTLPGLPSIYYGDEQAFRGVKGTGASADDELRPELPEHPAQLAPHGWWLYELHQRAIALRRRNPWIASARVQVRDKTNDTIDYVVTGADHRLDVSIDLSAGARAVVAVDGRVELAWPS